MTATQNGTTSHETKETLVLGQTSQGMEIRATLIRVTRYLAVFEVYNLTLVLRTSEVLEQFKIVVRDRTVYSGNAIVRSLVNAGLMTICEVTLEEGSWRDIEVTEEQLKNGGLRKEFGEFMDEWQRFQKVQPEFKVIVADIQTFLSSLRLWVEQIELGVRSSPSGDRLELERQLGDQLGHSAFPYLDRMFDKLEGVLRHLDQDLRPMHCAYVKRQLHPLILCAPFAFRSVHKPLGYAGDYEVVNMILRDPHEGGSLYAKVLNRWFIKQPPAEAHRNRIQYLTQKLADETMRLSRAGKDARVYNLGCGPAKEIQDFMAQHTLSNHTRFTLLDFNEETLTHARTMLEGAKLKHQRTTNLQFIKKSVAHALKGKDRSSDGTSDKYDFVYCAGLFDYLSDSICRQLMGVFYNMLAPGGLLVTTNVDLSNPIQNWLGDVLDWHLIYRNGKQMLSLCPERLSPDSARVVADITGVNIFLEIRKPAA